MSSTTNALQASIFPSRVLGLARSDFSLRNVGFGIRLAGRLSSESSTLGTSVTPTWLTPIPATWAPVRSFVPNRTNFVSKVVSTSRATSDSNRSTSFHVGTVINVDLNHHLGSHAGPEELHAGAANARELLDLLLDSPSQGIGGQHR